MRHNRNLLLGLMTLLIAIFTTATIAYSVCDNKPAWDAIWWAFMTFTTVGYGDQYPTSACARGAGILLVITAVFIVVPTLTALVSRLLIHDVHQFTHDEQEEIKLLLREIHATIGRPTSDSGSA